VTLQTLQAGLFALATEISTASPRKGTDLPHHKTLPLLRLFRKGKIDCPFSRDRPGLEVGRREHSLSAQELSAAGVLLRRCFQLPDLWKRGCLLWRRYVAGMQG